MLNTIPNVRLSNGVEMPQFGLGTFLSNPGELEPALFAALDAGYRHIDTAELYENEAEIGTALQNYFKTGRLSRKDIFLTTKIHARHNRPEDIEPTLRQQLADLQTDYIDLYLIHLPISFKPDGSLDKSVKLEESWQKVAEMYKMGLARAIGVSNFNNDQIARMNKIFHVHNSQVEAHIGYQQDNHLAFCRRNGVTVTAYSPLGSPGRNVFLDKVGQSANQYNEETDPLKSRIVNELCQKYGKTPAQILLRHMLQKGWTIIPKSTNERRLRENIDIFDFELNSDDMRKLNSFKQGPRLYQFDFMAGHPEDGFVGTRIGDSRK